MSTPPIARLPRMTDPMGRYWRQPADLHARVRVFETHATISEADWLALPRYETSKPSGVYPGKTWRRGPYLCWYGPQRRDAQGSYCMSTGIRALVQGPGTNLTYRQGGAA